MYEPLVSAIVPVYNGERYMAEAIESIHCQQYPNLEIIIVDDGSTDKSSEIALSLKGNIRYMRQENAGPAIARNTGIKLAKGDIITFLDADDLWTEGKLKRELDCFAVDPLLRIVLGNTQAIRVVDSRNNRLGNLKEFSSVGIVYLFGSTACRREVFQEVGLLDPSLCQSEDTEWFMRAQDYGAPRIVLEGISLIYRIHDQGITAKEPLRNKYLLKAFHLAIRRRKGEGAQGSCDERKEDRDEK